MAKEYYLYVKGKAVPVSEEVYKAYWKITEHEKYLQRKDWKYNVISFSVLDYDGHFVDNIIDEKIDLEKIVEVKMQIEELHRALNTLTKEEQELMEAIFYREESLRSIGKKEKVSYQAIGKRRDKILEKLRVERERLFTYKKVFSLFRYKNIKTEEMTMKELDNVISQLEKETKKKEQAENKIKLLKQKKSKLKRSADTKRKVEKGGVFEKFERQITGAEENTDNDLIYAFLDYVFSDNRYREKLKELTEKHFSEKGISLEETSYTENENDGIDDEEPQKDLEEFEDEI